MKYIFISKSADEVAALKEVNKILIDLQSAGCIKDAKTIIDDYDFDENKKELTLDLDSKLILKPALLEKNMEKITFSEEGTEEKVEFSGPESITIKESAVDEIAKKFHFEKNDEQYIVGGDNDGVELYVNGKGVATVTGMGPIYEDIKEYVEKKKLLFSEETEEKVEFGVKIKYTSTSDSEWGADPKKIEKDRLSYLLKSVTDNMSETEGNFELDFVNGDSFDYNVNYKPYGRDERDFIKINGKQLDPKLENIFQEDYASNIGDYYLAGLHFYVDFKLGRFEVNGKVNFSEEWEKIEFSSISNSEIELVERVILGLKSRDYDKLRRGFYSYAKNLTQWIQLHIDQLKSLYPDQSNAIEAYNYSEDISFTKLKEHNPRINFSVDIFDSLMKTLIKSEKLVFSVTPELEPLVDSIKVLCSKEESKKITDDERDELKSLKLQFSKEAGIEWKEAFSIETDDLDELEEGDILDDKYYILAVNPEGEKVVSEEHYDSVEDATDATEGWKDEGYTEISVTIGKDIPIEDEAPEEDKKSMGEDYDKHVVVGDYPKNLRVLHITDKTKLWDHNCHSYHDKEEDAEQWIKDEQAKPTKKKKNFSFDSEDKPSKKNFSFVEAGQVTIIGSKKISFAYDSPYSSSPYNNPYSGPMSTDSFTYQRVSSPSSRPYSAPIDDEEFESYSDEDILGFDEEQLAYGHPRYKRMRADDPYRYKSSDSEMIEFLQETYLEDPANASSFYDTEEASLLSFCVAKLKFERIITKDTCENPIKLWNAFQLVISSHDNYPINIYKYAFHAVLSNLKSKYAGGWLKGLTGCLFAGSAISSSSEKRITSLLPIAEREARRLNK